MGAIKYQAYPDFINELYAFFKAIAHPARLYAIFLISKSENNQIETKDLSEKIDLSQSTLSGHLRILRDVGLVKSKQVMVLGRNCLYYQVDQKALDVMLKHPAMKKIWDLLEHFTSSQKPIDAEFYSKYKDIISTYAPTNISQKLESNSDQ